MAYTGSAYSTSTMLQQPSTLTNRFDRSSGLTGTVGGTSLYSSLKQTAAIGRDALLGSQYGDADYRGLGFNDRAGPVRGNAVSQSLTQRNNPVFGNDHAATASPLDVDAAVDDYHSNPSISLRQRIIQPRTIQVAKQTSAASNTQYTQHTNAINQLTYEQVQQNVRSFDSTPYKVYIRTLQTYRFISTCVYHTLLITAILLLAQLTLTYHPVVPSVFALQYGVSWTTPLYFILLCTAQLVQLLTQRFVATTEPQYSWLLVPLHRILPLIVYAVVTPCTLVVIALSYIRLTRMSLRHQSSAHSRLDDDSIYIIASILTYSVYYTYKQLHKHQYVLQLPVLHRGRWNELSAAVPRIIVQSAKMAAVVTVTMIVAHSLFFNQVTSTVTTLAKPLLSVTATDLPLYQSHPQHTSHLILISISAIAKLWHVLFVSTLMTAVGEHLHEVISTERINFAEHSLFALFDYSNHQSQVMAHDYLQHAVRYSALTRQQLYGPVMSYLLLPSTTNIPLTFNALLSVLLRKPYMLPPIGAGQLQTPITEPAEAIVVYALHQINSIATRLLTEVMTPSTPKSALPVFNIIQRKMPVFALSPQTRTSALYSDLPITMATVSILVDLTVHALQQDRRGIIQHYLNDVFVALSALQDANQVYAQQKPKVDTTPKLKLLAMLQTPVPAKEANSVAKTWPQCLSIHSATELGLSRLTAAYRSYLTELRLPVDYAVKVEQYANPQ